MEPEFIEPRPYSKGEVQKAVSEALDMVSEEAVIIDTLRRRLWMEWDAEAPVTPLGQRTKKGQELSLQNPR